MFLILRQDTFVKLIVLYWIYIAAMMLLAVGTAIRRKVHDVRVHPLGRRVPKGRFSHLLLWLCFLALLAFQLVQAVRMAYADGDDAYYVAISAITQDAENMYVKLPYTGGETGLDARHGLAPFPIWISFLARMAGTPAGYPCAPPLPCSSAERYSM